MHLLTLKTVLAAADLDDPSSLPPLRTAQALATSAGASMHVVHVVPDESAKTKTDNASRARTTLSDAFDATQAMLNRLGLTLKPGGIHVIAGEPAHAIRVVADQVRADVVLVGPHRPEREGDVGRSLGSTALSVVTNSWAPCMVVTRPLRLPIERVLVPVDMSDTARGALVVGLSWASALRGGRLAGKSAVTLTALYVDERSPSAGGESRAARLLDEELERVRHEAGDWAGVVVESATVQRSDVAQAIVDFASRDGADLVVLGTRGLGVDTVGRMGSVSAAVTKQLETPVLLVPPAVWTAYARTQ